MPTIDEKEKFQADRKTAAALDAAAQARIAEIVQAGGAYDRAVVDPTGRELTAPRAILARNKETHEWERTK